MQPIDVYSRWRSNLLSVDEVWRLATQHAHEHVEWGPVLAWALKHEPRLHPELHAMLSSIEPGNTNSIAGAFEQLNNWIPLQERDDIAIALSIWASQSSVENCTLGDLVKKTSLDWQWNIAASLMDNTNRARPDHQTLVNALAMERLAQTQSSDQHVDASMLSKLLEP